MHISPTTLNFILIVGVIIYTIFTKIIFDKLKGAHQEYIKITEDQLKESEANFESLLKDKKIEALRRKEIESRLNRKDDFIDQLEEEILDLKANQMDDELERVRDNSLNLSRAVLEMVGRIGTVRGDLWKRHNTAEYTLAIRDFVRVASDRVKILSDKGELSLNDDTIKEIQNRLTKLTTELVEHTEIVSHMVEEMDLMTQNYFNDRDTYLLTGGPEPVAVIDPDVLSGEMFIPIIKNLTTGFDLPEKEEKMMIQHLINGIVYPIIILRNNINSQIIEPILHASGYMVCEGQFKTEEDKSFNSFSFVFPCISRKVMEVNHMPDTKTYLNLN